MFGSSNVAGVNETTSSVVIHMEEPSEFIFSSTPAAIGLVLSSSTKLSSPNFVTSCNCPALNFIFGESCKLFFILLPKRIELPNLPFSITLPSSGITCLKLKLDKNLSPKVLT